MRGTGELASDWQDIFVESLVASTAPRAGVVGSTTVALGAVVAVAALPSSVAPVGLQNNFYNQIKEQL